MKILLTLFSLITTIQSFNLSSLNFDNNYSPNNLKISLLENYNRDTIPLQNNHLNVSLGLVLNSIDSVDQKDGTLNLNVWLRYKWVDYQMIWDKDEWNISQLTFSSNPDYEFSLWTPDIYLYNSGEIPMKNLEDSRLVVKNDGSIFWSRPGYIKIICDFNLLRFPFDEQECFIKLGSWNYDKDTLTLHKDNPDIELTYYKSNEEWKLESIFSEINIKNYSCCLNSFYDLTYTFIIKRNYDFYSINIILPLFLTTSLIMITIFIPNDSGEKISFSVTIMLSLIIYLLILSDHIPKTNNQPILSNIIVLLIILSLISIFFTTIIISLEFEKKNLEDKKRNFIENYIARKIYNLFYKINNNSEVKSISRNNSYSLANQDNLELIDNLSKIIKKTEIISNFILIIYFISVLIYFLCV